MNFTTQGNNYGSPYPTGIGQTNAPNQNLSFLHSQEKLNTQSPGKERPGIEARIFGNFNEEAMDAFPSLRINRVNSKEYKERQEKLEINNVNSSLNQTLSNSLSTKTYGREVRGNEKFSTSADKSGSSSLNVRQGLTANQSFSYANNPNYATYKRDNSRDKDSDGGSGEKQIGYKRIQNLVTPHMVSSVISRESNEKGGSYGIRLNAKPLSSSSSRGKDDDIADQAYNLYSSRHPTESIRKSTIQISKAISNNAIIQLQRQNNIQSQTIKKLQTDVSQLKASLHKWDDVKNRYQMDLQAKTRQIFDLERGNKRLMEQVQSLRSYRTMQTVEQVIITKLKQEIMNLNKKIIEMQAAYYKNQKRPTNGIENQQSQAVRKVEINLEVSKNQVELLSEELKKEKEKCWKLQREKEQYLAQRNIAKQDYEKQINNAKADIAILNQEILKQIAAVRTKQSSIEEINKAHSVEIQNLTEKTKAKDIEISKLKAQLTMTLQAKARESPTKRVEQQLTKQKQMFDAQLSRQLAQKEQEYKNKINEVEQTIRFKVETEFRQKEKEQAQTSVNESSKELQTKYKDIQAKYNTLLPEMNLLKADKMKLQQKSKQDEIELKRAQENFNIWKMKAESISSLENERNQLRAKVRQLENSQGNKSQLLTKYDELMAEHQTLKEKFKTKEEQTSKNQALYAKIKTYYNSQQTRMGGFSKQIKQLQAKVVETQSKFKTLLAKVQLQQFKYKELCDKMTSDSQTYMVYIKKLQEENELIYQKYLKARKLCRTNRIKLDDDNDAHEKVDYSTFRQYLEKQVFTQFTKMILPAFESKINQKMAAYETKLIQRSKKVIEIKVLVERLKKSRQAKLTR